MQRTDSSAPSPAVHPSTKKHSGDLSVRPETFDAAFHRYNPYIRSFARKIYPGQADEDDLVQEGFLGLLDAFQRFDPSRHVQFSTYALQRIRGAIMDARRAADPLSRHMRIAYRSIIRAKNDLSIDGVEPSAEEIAMYTHMHAEQIRRVLTIQNMSIPVEIDATQRSSYREYSTHYDPIDSLEIPNVDDPLTRYIETTAQQQTVERLIQTLSPREQIVIRAIYFDRATIEQIGKTLGVNGSRVSQIHRGALLKMRQNASSIEEIAHMGPML